MILSTRINCRMYLYIDVIVWWWVMSLIFFYIRQASGFPAFLPCFKIFTYLENYVNIIMWVLYPYLLVRTTIKDLHLEKLLVVGFLSYFILLLKNILCGRHPAGRNKAGCPFCGQNSIFSKFNLAVLFSDIVPTQMSIGPEYFGTIL